MTAVDIITSVRSRRTSAAIVVGKCGTTRPPGRDQCHPLARLLLVAFRPCRDVHGDSEPCKCFRDWLRATLGEAAAVGAFPRYAAASALRRAVFAISSTESSCPTGAGRALACSPSVLRALCLHRYSMSYPSVTTPLRAAIGAMAESFVPARTQWWFRTVSFVTFYDVGLLIDNGAKL